MQTAGLASISPCTPYPHLLQHNVLHPPPDLKPTNKTFVLLSVHYSPVQTAWLATASQCVPEPDGEPRPAAGPPGPGVAHLGADLPLQSRAPPHPAQTPQQPADQPAGPRLNNSEGNGSIAFIQILMFYVFVGQIASLICIKEGPNMVRLPYHCFAQGAQQQRVDGGSGRPFSSPQPRESVS